MTHFKYTVEQLKNSNTQLLYKNKTKKIIPGGTQLLSKRPEMFAPDIWPAYYSSAKGCTIKDLDGNEFIDMSIMSVGSVILGYADDDVDHAVIESIKRGVSTTLNCPEEIELAEQLITLHPWAEMVRYARSGGEAMSLAVRIARAHTKKDVIFFSGYHGWNDWYLAANLGNSSGLDGQLMPGLEPNGVPRGLTGTAVPFMANNIDALKNQIKDRENDIGAFVIEPARGENASPDYLNSLKQLAHEIGAVLIFDEITSGFRECCGGVHLKYGVSPDIAVFAKAMANGYAMSAIIGTEKVMQSAQTTFISSTNWTDRIGPTAALATIKKFKENSVHTHNISLGKKIKHIWKEAAQKSNLNIVLSGLDSLPSFAFSYDNNDYLNTAFTIGMLERGYLGFRQFRPSFAHNEKILDEFSLAVDEVFASIEKMIKQETPLPERPHHKGFYRLTKE